MGNVRLVPAAVLLLGSCSGTSSAPEGGTSPQNELRSNLPRNLAPAVDPGDAAQLESDNLAFGLDLYAQLAARHAGNNVVLSQTSVSLALAMLYAGAANDTATQIAAAAHFTLAPERLHAAFNALDLALEPAADNNGFQIRLANSVWPQRGFPFLTSYLDLLGQNYGAGLFLEDFATAPEPARADINRWISERTDHLIPELFGAGTIDRDTRLVLANAIYFHGDWLDPFKPTSPVGVFHATGGDVNVSMMVAGDDSNASLWEGPGWLAASLTYAPGTATMIVVVPDPGTFEAFEQGLTADQLATILRPTQPSAARVSMPKFHFATPSPLEDVLRALGMTDAFESGLADFSAMDGGHDLRVGRALHQAVIAVDEEGTTAAAATGITMVPLALTMPSKLVIVDRPFLFFIRHVGTGAILFQGRVLDPSQ